jgi:hypothetical protein
MPYVIKWHYTTKDRHGHGPRIDSKEVAEQLCRDLNDEYPEIKHEVIEVPEFEPHEQQSS